MAEVKIVVPQANEVATQGEVLAGVEAVLGILPSQGGVAAEVQAASTAGLFAGWLGSASAFEANAAMSRIDLAILATDAMGLTGTAAADIANISTYGYLTNVSDTGYDLGFANAMLKYGVVPPVSRTDYGGAGAVTTEMLDVALYRMWWNVDVPVTATVTPAQVNTAPGMADALALAATNRLGGAVPATNLAQYLPTYTLVGSGATAGSVKGNIFTSEVGGLYTVALALAGPLLPVAKAVTATALVHVVSPPPPVTSGVTATFIVPVSSGTITVNGIAAGDSVTVNGTTFFANSNPSGSDEYDNAATLASDLSAVFAQGSNLVASFNSNNPDQVVVYQVLGGTLGTQPTLATNNATDITLSGPTLTGPIGAVTFMFPTPMNTSTNLLGDLTVTDGDTFGASPNAFWINDEEYQVEFGTGSTLTVGDVIDLSTTDAAGKPVSASVTVPPF